VILVIAVNTGATKRKLPCHRQPHQKIFTSSLRYT